MGWRVTATQTAGPARRLQPERMTALAEPEKIARPRRSGSTGSLRVRRRPTTCTASTRSFRAPPRRSRPGVPTATTSFGVRQRPTRPTTTSQGQPNGSRPKWRPRTKYLTFAGKRCGSTFGASGCQRVGCQADACAVECRAALVVGERAVESLAVAALVVQLSRDPGVDRRKRR